MSDTKHQDNKHQEPIKDVDDVEVDELDEESGAGTLSSAGTASCPASLGTAACW